MAVSYVCNGTVGYQSIGATQTSIYGECSVPWAVSNQSVTLDTLNTLFSTYFALDTDMFLELSIAFFVLWITGYGVGRAIKSMGYV